MKILNKLTLKNLRLNKTRTIVTVIGIILSTALICVVAGMATSGQQTLITAEIKWSGDYEAELSCDSPEKIDDIRANRNVKAAYLKQELGCAMLPGATDKNYPYIDIKAFDKAALNDCFSLDLKEGRFPENDSELVLSQSVIANSDSKFAVGDKITLDVGKRTDGRGNYTPAGFEYGLSTEEWNSEIDDEIVEELVDTRTKTYTIVGILDKCYTGDVCEEGFSACSTAITLTGNKEDSDNATENYIYVDYLPECEKNYLEITAQIMGLTEEEVTTAVYDVMTPEMAEKSGFDNVNLNLSVLRYKGYAVGDSTMTMLFWLAAIIIIIVILASVFVIRNSFAISITEKTKLYGMLASVGATSRQIRRNVLFEGFCLGAIGIPAGLILGISVIGILVTIINVLLAEVLNGVQFEFGVPVWALVAAVLLSAVTILFSTLSTAIRASKIAPVTAIRGNKDIKISKKKKAYKAPKYVKKLYGTGGVVAYKNLKRSRKKYRTTVISIVVSVMLFVAISSFMDYGTSFTNNYYGGYDYNIIVDPSNDGGGLAEWEKNADEIKKLDGINESMEIYSNFQLALVSSDNLTDEFLNSEDTETLQYLNDMGNKVISTQTVAFDDDTYREFLDELSLDYDDAKDKIIFYNAFNVMDENGKAHPEKLVKDDKINSLEYYDCESQNTKKLDVVCAFTEPTDFIKKLGISDCTLIASKEWFKNNLSMDYMYTNPALYIDAENADEFEEDIFEREYTNINVMNIDKVKRQNNAIVLIIEIFIFGFIAVISLIGVTNIFNTISTNMRLRSKEFAMLKSVGMTRKEFNRMIRLESLFYGVKSLLIGIPLGILGGVAIFFAFNEGEALIAFVVPWKAILISIVFVFVIVWLIMKYSVSKVSKQNIIETIRNDNI